MGLTTVLRAKLARAIKRLSMGLGILSLRGFPLGAAMAALVLFRKPALGFMASVGALTSLMLLLASVA